ncbi:MAG: response regulator [Thermoguttaceae bacterium]|nr:response regulator [Thermoguttaceae bacterium]MDW8039245.1 response regulator [Thermoguttaceae bacterium]
MPATVLLVDDDPNVLRGVVRLFRHQPFVFYTAHNAEEAMEVLKSRAVDVLVTDDQMPGLCGIELLAWTAKHFPEVRRIMLTGFPTTERIIRAINESGVFRFFTKPCDPVALALAIHQAVEEKPGIQKTKPAQ